MLFKSKIWLHLDEDSIKSTQIILRWVKLILYYKSFYCTGSVHILAQMGCKSSKQPVLVTSLFDNAGSCSGRNIGRNDGFVMESDKKKKKKDRKKRSELGLSESCRASWGGFFESESFRLGNLRNYIEGEQVAAGWPGWLSIVAAEAVQGLVPLKAESFEKLDKVVNTCMHIYFIYRLISKQTLLYMQNNYYLGFFLKMPPKYI